MKQFLTVALMLMCGARLFGAAPQFSIAASASAPVSRIHDLAFSFFDAVDPGFEVSQQQRENIDRAIFWSWMSVGAFGANTLGFIITTTTDSNVGGLLTLFSVGFWTTSNIFTALTHREIIHDLDDTGSSVPRPRAAGLAALVAGAFGLGTLSAISLTFGDTTGAAATVAYAGIAISSVAGGYGIYKTFEYAEAAGFIIDFF